MSQPTDQIAHWRKMANDDPDNELGHYRLGQELTKAGQHDEAIKSFRRTLEIAPEFSKVYQLLGTALLQMQQRDEAIGVLRKGFEVADARGDNMPRDEMARMLVQLGEPAPTTKKTPPAAKEEPETGFRCHAPRCMAGVHAHQLPKQPMSDDMGRRIYETVCATCWNDWLRNHSIKVINELRLDLSTERGQEDYDRYMREFFGLE